MKLSEQIRELQPSSGLACDGSFLFGWRQAAEKTAQLVEEHEAEAANDKQIRQRKMDELGNDLLRLTHDNVALTKRVAELEYEHERAVERNTQYVSRGVQLLERVADLERWIDCGQDGPCAKAPGCNRHWEERNRELVQEVRALQTKDGES